MLRLVRMNNRPGPVCAITVNAMLRLVRMNNRPGPEAMVRTFSLRAYYPSAESIIRASA